MLGNCCLGDDESQSPLASHLLVYYADFQQEGRLSIFSIFFFVFCSFAGKESVRWPMKQADRVNPLRPRQPGFHTVGPTAGETARGETGGILIALRRVRRPSNDGTRVTQVHWRRQELKSGRTIEFPPSLCHPISLASRQKPSSPSLCLAAADSLCGPIL